MLMVVGRIVSEVVSIEASYRREVGPCMWLWLRFGRFRIRVQSSSVPADIISGILAKSSYTSSSEND